MAGRGNPGESGLEPAISGCGSLPFGDPARAWAHVLASAPRAPYLPRCRRPAGDMIRDVLGAPGRAPALPAALAALRRPLEARPPAAPPTLAVAGPATLAASAPGSAGDGVETRLARVLSAARAALGPATIGRVVLDEPVLGALSGPERAAAFARTRAFAGALRAGAHGPPVAVGLHVCSRPFPTLFTATEFSWLSLDLLAYAPEVAASRDALAERLRAGALLAAGVVAPRAGAFAPGVAETTLDALVRALRARGLEASAIARALVLTPTCGTILQTVARERAVQLELRALAARVRDLLAESS